MHVWWTGNFKNTRRMSFLFYFLFLSSFPFWSLVLVRKAISNLVLLQACSFGQLQLLPIANSLFPPYFLFSLFPLSPSPNNESSLYRQQRLIFFSIYLQYFLLSICGLISFFPITFLWCPPKMPYFLGLCPLHSLWVLLSSASDCYIQFFVTSNFVCSNR